MQQAPEVPAGPDWSGYYAGRAGRAPHELALRAHDEYVRGGRGPGEAVDLGCGDGTETGWLLRHGWSVTAVDATAACEPYVQAAAEGFTDRLDLVVADLADVDLPRADLVLAMLSLPFLAPSAFEPVWMAVRAALQPGAVVGAHLFGPQDTWASEPPVPGQQLTFHDRSAAERLLDGLDVLRLEETERDGPSGSGPKHWHVLELVARRPAAG